MTARDDEGQAADEQLRADALRLLGDAVPDTTRRTRVYFLPELLGHGMFGSPDREEREEIAEGKWLEWEAKWED